MRVLVRWSLKAFLLVEFEKKVCAASRQVNENTAFRKVLWLWMAANREGKNAKKKERKKRNANSKSGEYLDCFCLQKVREKSKSTGSTVESKANEKHLEMQRSGSKRNERETGKGRRKKKKKAPALCVFGMLVETWRYIARADSKKRFRLCPVRVLSVGRGSDFERKLFCLLKFFFLFFFSFFWERTRNAVKARIKKKRNEKAWMQECAQIESGRQKRRKCKRRRERVFDKENVKNLLKSHPLII